MIYYSNHIKFLLCAMLFLATVTEILAAEGDLDPSFDSDGIVSTDNGSNSEQISDIAIQPDGKIIAVGLLFVNSARRTVFVRYNANGSVDSSFGTSGKVIIESVFVARLALQSNGKIVLVGSDRTSPNVDSYVARLNSDGSFDTTFNGTGTVTLDLRGTNDSLSSVKILPDGKILTGGSSARPAPDLRSDFAIIRFNADGSLDATFDGDGKVFTVIPPTGESAGIADLEVQPDGKILAAGSVSVVDTPGDDPDQIFAVARYNANGSLDTTFDGDGVANPRFLPTSGNGVTSTSVPTNIFARNDGKILVVGKASSCCAPFPRGQAALVRFNADGSLDTTFASGGKALISFPADFFSVGKAAIQTDNKIVVAGSAGNIKQSFAAVARLTSDGALDLTFSGDGRSIIAPSPTNTRANTAALQPDGKIVIGGSITSFNFSGEDFLLARFEASSCLANCFAARQRVADFDGDGKTDIAVFRPSNGYWYISKSSGGYSFIQWGTAVDLPVPGDYDGDGKADVAVYRKSADSTWYILRSSDNTFLAKQWGATNIESQLLLTDTPMPADYDGDGKTDLAVYRLTDAIGETGRFVVLQSLTSSRISTDLGNHFFTTVPADYDGDGRTDYAIFRGGVWSILQNSTSAFRTEYFGLASDKLVPADYDGDGKADIAVWRPSNGYWYWISSRDKSFNSIQFGLSEDKPVPGDYDGDGKTDFAVFRPSSGVWYMQQSTKGFRAEQFGLSTDIPIPNVFVR